MNKYYGNIGYAETREVSPGVYKEEIVEKPYFGNVDINRRGLRESQDGINDDVTASIEFNILSDPYALQNFQQMRYITYLGNKWKVNDVGIVDYPRLHLQIGGLYNEHEE